MTNDSTTPADVAELCERLNADADESESNGRDYEAATLREAATRIAALAAEVERLRQAGLAYRDSRNEYIAKFKAAEAAREQAEARLAALMQPDEAMVERAKEAILAFDDGDSLPTDAWAEDLARACLTAALKEGASGLTPTSN